MTILLVFAYYALKTVAYPIELAVDFGYGKTDYFSWLYHDIAFLHSVLLTTSAIHDFALRQPLTVTTKRHLSKTLLCLNQRLDTNDACLVDSTMYIVMTLSLLASMFGDHTAANTHMSGLEQIMHLRSGRESLRRNSKLQFKIDRSVQACPFHPSSVSIQR